MPKAVPTFVTRWVDYTGKYGLAYHLSNASSGMHFNDNTSIILSPTGDTYDYFSSGNCTSGSIGQHPPELEKKVKLAIKYSGYMNDNLHGPEIDCATAYPPAEKVFVAEFRRAVKAVFFRMSDNVFQVHLYKACLN